MVEKQLGDVINKMSPSRIDAAQRCLALFKYRYVDVQRHAEPRAWKTAFGTAMDDAANGVYQQKLDTHVTPSANDVAERFDWAWDLQKPLIEQWEDAKPGDILDRGTQGAKMWRENIALYMQPTQKPQFHVEREIVDPKDNSTWTLHGFIDLVGQVDGLAASFNDMAPGTTINVDLKTSGKRYSESKLQTASQPAAYTILTGEPKFAYHVITTTKKPVTQWLQADISPSIQHLYVVRAGMTRRMIRNAYMTGDWMPNRDHVLCSRKYCGEWARCQAEFGGEVKA